MNLHQILVFLHVFGATLFFLGHGATALAMFEIRKNQEPIAIRALMGLRVTQVWSFGAGFLLMGIPAIWMGFQAKTWGNLWMWGSTVIFFIIWIVMGSWGRGYYDAIEMALDPSGEKATKAKKPETRSLDEVLASGRPWLLTWVGILGTALIVWMMIFKPV